MSISTPSTVPATSAGEPEPRDPAATDGPGRSAMLRSILVGLSLDTGLPVAAYGLVRILGASVLAALVVGAVVSFARAAWITARRREVDPLALFMIGIFVVGLLLSLWSGSPRFLLVKESFGTGAAGLAFLLTCLRGKPLAYYASQRVAAPTAAERAEWAQLWLTEPVFRRRFVTMSSVIGGALVAEAAVRVALVFILPADVMVVVSAVLAATVLTAVSVWALGYGLRTEAAVERSHQP